MFFYLHFACLCFCESPLAEEKEGLFNTWAQYLLKLSLGVTLTVDVDDEINIFEYRGERYPI